MTEIAIPPALYQHCCRIYNKMMEQSSKVEAEDGTMIVYDGFLTHVVRKLDLSNPYYTFATRALKEMGCIRQVKRGGGKASSQWELIRSPTEELFSATNPLDPSKSQLGRKGVTGMLQTQVNDLNNRVNMIEEWLEAHK